MVANPKKNVLLSTRLGWLNARTTMRQCDLALPICPPRIGTGVFTLLLAASGEHTYDEIAAMLGTPLGTIKWRVAEARRIVSSRLER